MKKILCAILIFSSTISSAEKSRTVIETEAEEGFGRTIKTSEDFQCTVKGKGVRYINRIKLVDLKGTSYMSTKIEFEGLGWDITGEADFDSKEIEVDLYKMFKEFSPLYGSLYAKADRSDEKIIAFLKKISSFSDEISNCGPADAIDKSTVGATVNENIINKNRTKGKHIDFSKENVPHTSRKVRAK